MSCRLCPTALIPSVLLLALSALGAAHRDPCPRFHASPPDHGTYVCGNLGPYGRYPAKGYAQGGKPPLGVQRPPPSPQPAEAWPVEASFRQAIQLWADERFEALWEHGQLENRYRVSREAFARWMRHRVVKPTCCWGQIRGVRVYLQAAEEALVEAQVGFDVKTLGTTVVRSLFVYLRREEGVWRVALQDLMTKPEVGLPWDLPTPG
jgi:hypothetical protein